MQQQMAAYAGTSITTELIQKYLDENKQLILAILDNQNLGKLNECANYQAKLQQNLMYLAAIADAQPQVPAAAQSMQPSQQYLQQQQQMMMTQQRGSVPQYLQPGQQQQQQQQGSQNTSSPQSYHMMNSSMGGNGNQSISEYAKADQASRDGGAPNLNVRNDAREGNGVAGEDSEASYLKSSE